jgi:hypothetical protein
LSGTEEKKGKSIIRKAIQWKERGGKSKDGKEKKKGNLRMGFLKEKRKESVRREIIKKGRREEEVRPTACYHKNRLSTVLS